MIITWTPQHSRHRFAYTQPRPDVLAVDGVEYEFDAGLVEYDLPDELRRHVTQAKRIDGVLHLTIIDRGATAERTVDYGTEEVLR